MIRFSKTRTAQAVLGALLVVLTGCSTEYIVTPIADNSLSVRYDQGHAIVYSDKKFGAVQITPLGMNGDDRLGFSISALNKSGMPANFGIENVSLLQADGTPGKLFTAVELEHEAKVKAGWQTFAAVLGAVAEGAAANANAHSTASGIAYTRAGPVSYHVRTYDPAAAQEGMREAGAQLGDNLQAIKTSLNDTMTTIQNHILQTTTVDPGDSYGGIALADTLSSSKFPQTFALGVNWNGEDHVFRFVVGTDKSPSPEQTAPELAAPAPNATQTAAAAPAATVAQPGAQPSTAVIKASFQRKDALPEGYASHSDTSELPAASGDETSPVSFDQWEKAQHAHSGSNSSAHHGTVISGGVSQN